jgi:hypothetical protein
MLLEPNSTTNSRPGPLTVAEMGVWILLATAGWYSLTAYGFKTDAAQADGSDPTSWPAESSLEREPGRNQLLVFLHPKCPCSFATVTELQRLLFTAQQSGKQLPQLHVVACVPETGAERLQWQNTRLLSRAKELSEQHLHFDIGGVEANRFAARTSGTVLMFDEHGRRLYSGGITAARGHEGPNVGAESVAKLISGTSEPMVELPPLGCRLVGPSACFTDCASGAQGSVDR